jgi:hypothetical protein
LLLVFLDTALFTIALPTLSLISPRRPFTSLFLPNHFLRLFVHLREITWVSCSFIIDLHIRQIQQFRNHSSLVLLILLFILHRIFFNLQFIKNRTRSIR